MLHPAHPEYREFLSYIPGAACDTSHVLVSENKLFEILAALFTCIFKNRHNDTSDIDDLILQFFPFLLTVYSITYGAINGVFHNIP